MAGERLADVVRAAAQGNQEALADVINRFGPLLRKYSLRLGYDPADAEQDLVEALIRAVRSLKKQ